MTVTNGYARRPSPVLCSCVFVSQLKLTNQNGAFGHPADNPLLSVMWMSLDHLHSVVLLKRVSRLSLSECQTVLTGTLFSSI